MNVIPPPGNNPPAHSSGRVSPPPTGFRDYTYPISNGREVTFRLPLELTADDFEAIIHWIEGLKYGLLKKEDKEIYEQENELWAYPVFVDTIKGRAVVRNRLG